MPTPIPIYIDGVPNREPQNAYISLTPGIEGVQELEVYTGKYNAEFGFSGSAVVNITTKSGSNQLHGAAFEFLRNDATDARNFFGGGEPNTPFRRNQFGGAIGGPDPEEQLVLLWRLSGHSFEDELDQIYNRPDGKDADGRLLGVVCPRTGRRCRQYVWADLRSQYASYRRQWQRDQRDSVFGQHHSAVPMGFLGAAMNAAEIFGVANLPGISNNLRI